MSVNYLTMKNTDGSCLGQSGESISFYGAAPVAQRSGAVQAAISTTAATSTTPYGFSTVTQANAVVTLLNEIQATLAGMSLFKGGA